MSSRTNVLILLSRPVLALAYPGIGGGRGLFRVQNPLVEDKAGLSISMHALTHYSTFGDSLQQKEFEADLVGPELNYAPLATKYARPGAVRFVRRHIPICAETDGVQGRDLTMGVHDLKAGAKVSVPIIPVFKLGGIGDLHLPHARHEIATGLSRPRCRWEGSRGRPVLAAVAGSAQEPAQRDVQRRQGGRLQSLRRRHRAGGQGFRPVRRGAVAPAGEFQLGIFDTDSGEVRITPGVAFGSNTSGITFKVGYTIAPAKHNSDELIVGFSLATPFGRRLPPGLGTIAATVTDARTGAALGANVAFPENPKMNSLTSDRVTGVFRSRTCRPASWSSRSRLTATSVSRCPSASPPMRSPSTSSSCGRWSPTA